MAMWKNYKAPDLVMKAVAAGVPRIRAFREGEGVNSSVLASAADISAERMLQLEGGAIPTGDELRNISDALAVPLDMLADK